MLPKNTTFIIKHSNAYDTGLLPILITIIIDITV